MLELKGIAVNRFVFKGIVINKLAFKGVVLNTVSTVFFYFKEGYPSISYRGNFTK